ncbi:MAG: hypothetical protein IIT46_02910 [Lachnospiraceae bacterium]|nr:hypothetical protein [Lachnospiraceae bacterium]
MDTAETIAAVEFKVNNVDEWISYTDLVTALDELGKTGATISVRVKGVTTAAGTEALTDKGEFAAAIVRVSAAKTFKLAKKAAGPAVSIDYDNHIATIKKGTEYGTASATADPETYIAASSEPNIKTLHNL